MKKKQVHSIKNAILPIDFYRHELPEVPLKKATWNEGGLCPFHPDTKPGSFFVNLQNGAFYCFSCGSSGSDCIAFTMLVYGLGFIEAMQKLAYDWGLS